LDREFLEKKGGAEWGRGKRNHLPVKREPVCVPKGKSPKSTALVRSSKDLSNPVTFCSEERGFHPRKGPPPKKCSFPIGWAKEGGELQRRRASFIRFSKKKSIRRNKSSMGLKRKGESGAVKSPAPLKRGRKGLPGGRPAPTGDRKERKDLLVKMNRSKTMLIRGGGSPPENKGGGGCPI